VYSQRYVAWFRRNVYELWTQQNANSKL